MPTWRELSLSSSRAAQQLHDQGHFRSSVSRSYYACYSALTGHLVARGTAFPGGYANPRHAHLPGYVTSGSFPGLDADAVRTVRRHIRYLYKFRLTADYEPGLDCGEAMAREALRMLGSVRRELGV
jgi:hypothetical protein